MFKPLTLEQYQKDIDDGWNEYYGDKIAYWRKVSLRVNTEQGQKLCDAQIEHYKKMRRRR